MSHTNLQHTVDSHLRRVGSSLTEFLHAALGRGDSSQAVANELLRVTDIKVSNVTVLRWVKALDDTEAGP